MPNDMQEQPNTPETSRTGTPQNETFDPAAMQAEANRILQDGTMPSKERLEAVLERIRAEYGPKILTAREQDERENSSE